MYSISFDGKKIELPSYSVELATKIDALDNGNKNYEDDIQSKLQNIYGFLEDVLGSEKTAELIGSFPEADPNDINILFLMIVDEYNKPLMDYTIKQSTRVLDDPKIKQAIAAIDQVVEANKND